MTRTVIIVVAFVALTLLSVPALAQSGTAGNLYITSQSRTEVHLGDVMHHAVALQPLVADGSAYNVYVLIMLSDALSNINYESTLSCMQDAYWLLCYTPHLRGAVTIDVYGTVAGPAIGDVYLHTLVGDSTNEQWFAVPRTNYLGCACGTVPMPDEWTISKLYFADVRGR